MNSWVWWLIAGIFSVIGGFIALTHPFAASMTVNFMAGWIFMFVGVLTGFSAFSDQGWGQRILAILLGIAMFLLGLALFERPLAGLISLTMATAIMMFAAGIFRIVIGFGAQDSSLKWVMILSGVLSIILSIMIMSNFPQSAAVVLGLFLGIELISNGIALIALSFARRKLTKA